MGAEVERVPVLRVGGVLVVSVRGDLADRSVVALREEVAERLGSSGVRGVLIDISGLEVVDSFVGRVFASVASLSRLFDAVTVVVGMRPAVAMTLVELGLTLGGVRTALDVDRGLRILGESGWRGAGGEGVW